MLKEIKRHIRYKREDTIVSHLKTCMLIQRDFSGGINGNKFVIWRYSGWSGIFYRVISGEVSTDNGKIKCKIHSQLNVVGKLVSSIIMIMWMYGVYLGAEKWILNSSNSVVVGLFISIVLILIPVLLFILTQRSQKRTGIEEVTKLLQSISLDEQS